jgi:predicted short-subunit dehydrogenase-like oxidoreductase (DUF2520 family)
MIAGAANKELKVVFIGSGNVAVHLSKVFIQPGFKVSQVFSRTPDHARALASSINTMWTSDIYSLDDDADIYFLVVSDQALDKILSSRSWNNKFLVHMAGSVPMDIFSNYTNRYGVLYILQSFSAFRKIDLKGLPAFIEANTDENLRVLKNIAERINLSVHLINSEERKYLHLTAVFASNFVNHMLSIAQQLSEKENKSFEWFKPLIAETVSKALMNDPVAAQTGPARRNDKIVLDEHIEMLKEHPEWQKIYTFVSESIRLMYNNQ